MINQMIKGSKEKFFVNQIFDENNRRLLQGKSFWAKKYYIYKCYNIYIQYYL